MYNLINKKNNNTLHATITLAWPMMIGMFSYTIMDITDTFVAGSLGKTELAAIGIGSAVVFIINSFFIGFFESIKIIVSQAFGSKNLKTIQHSGWSGVILAIPLGLIIATSIFFKESIFEIYGGTESVKSISSAYFQIRILFSPIWYIGLSLISYFQGQGLTKIPMQINMLVSIINLFLDFLLVYGFWIFPKFGILGTAYATVISMAIGVLILFYRFISINPFVRPRVFLIKKISKLGFAIGIKWFFDHLGFGLLASLIARMGEIEIASNQITNKIMLTSLLPCYAVSEAACILAGQSVGANLLNKVKKIYFSGIIVVTLLMTIFAAMYILIPKFITKIFQNDPNVIILSASLITIMAIFQITYGISMIASAILNGAGDVKFTMISSILSTWLISIPICYFLAIAIKMKAEGVWIGLSIKAFVLFLIMTIRLFSNKWKKIKIIKNINN